MLFQRFEEKLQLEPQDTIVSTASQTWNSAPIKKKITREKHVSKIRVVATIVTTGTLTSARDGIIGLVRKLSFTAGGKKYVNGVSGSSLIVLQKNIAGLDSYTEAAIGATAAGTYRICYTINCFDPRVEEPAGDTLLIPMPNFNDDGYIEFDVAASSEIGTWASTNVTSLKFDFFVERVNAPLNTPHAVWELAESETAYTVDQRGFVYELQAQGNYTGLLIRQMNGSYVEADQLTSDGLFSVEIGNTAVRKTTTLKQVIENEESAISARGKFTASPWFDFLTSDMGAVSAVNSVLQADPSATSGSRFKVIQDITRSDSTTARIRYVTHRIFGDLSSLMLGA